MAKMYLMCGLSGVGKTTFAKEIICANKNMLYLGVDDFYAKVNGDECIHENQFEVWIEFYKAIHEAEVNGIDCVVDTNAITLCHRTQFLDWFPTFEHHLVFLEASEELRFANNQKRRRVIPNNVMHKMWMNSELPERFTDGECWYDTEDDRWKSILHVKNINNENHEIGYWRGGI